MTRVGMLLTCLVLVAGCSSLNPNDHTHPGQVALGADGYTVTAEFADMQNVVPNSTVQLDNVVIGTVTKISVEDWSARVTMRLLDSVRLPANAQVRIGQKTLLGAQYVEVMIPGRPQGTLTDGASIPMDASGVYPATEQVLAGVSLLLNNGGLSQISTITGELNAALSGRVPDTRALIERLNTLLGTLDASKHDLLRVLDSADSLAARVSGQSERVHDAVLALAPGIRAVAAQRRELVDALTDLGRFSVSAESVVTSSKTALLANLRSLRPVLKDLAEAGSDVANSLKYFLTVPFPVNTTSNMVRGDYTNLFMTFDVSPEALADSFLGIGRAGPAFEAGNPLTSPLGSSPTEVAPRSGLASGTASPSAPAPTPAPTPDTDPGPAPCSLLASLLGGCA